MLSPFNDEYFMKQAYLEAQKAFDADEVPVGAVIVCKIKLSFEMFYNFRWFPKLP